MNREIKFRVFDTHLKTYTENAHQYHEFVRYLSDVRYICEQFTGLADKNGKDIYEGDILKDEIGEVFVIEHQDPVLQLRIRRIKTSKYGWQRIYDLGCFSKLKRLDIIGNIQENPKLLNI